MPIQQQKRLSVVLEVGTVVGWEHGMGLPGVLGYWVLCFLTWALVPRVCLLHDNAQGSALEICAQLMQVKFLKQRLLENKIKGHIV